MKSMISEIISITISLLNKIGNSFKFIAIRIINWTVDSIRSKNYHYVNGIYIGLAYLFLMPALLFDFQSKLIGLTPIICLVGVSAIVLYKSFYDVYIDRKKYKKIEFWNIIKTLSFAQLALSFLFIYLFLSITGVLGISVVIMILSFYLYLYSSSQYFMNKWITKWWGYSILFITMPIIALIISTLLVPLISVLSNINLKAFDPFIGVFVICGTIILINICVLFSPKDKIIEVKVAVYFILALSSTASYCFFVSDYLTDYLIATDLLAIFESREELLVFVDTSLKWVTLPYLIGSVFGCFVVELLERNRVLNKSMDKNSIKNELPSHESTN